MLYPPEMAGINKNQGGMADFRNDDECKACTTRQSPTMKEFAERSMLIQLIVLEFTELE